MATRVTIKVDLERRIRAGDVTSLVDIVKLLDEERERVAAPKPASGLGYKELVALLRFELGDDLLVPPKPSTAYIVRLVNKIKDYGLEKEDIHRVAVGVRRSGRKPPYTLEYIVYSLLEHLRGGGGHDEGGKEMGFKPRTMDLAVFTGRPEGGDDGT